MEAASVYRPAVDSLWSPAEFDSLLVWAAEKGASDIFLVPHDYAWIRLDGKMVRVTEGPIESFEIDEYLKFTSRNDAADASLTGTDFNFSHHVELSSNRQVRLRCNATTCRAGRSEGRSLVLRVIPQEVPNIVDFHVEQALLENMAPEKGLVAIAGKTGSGKSTLLAAILRWIAENQPRSIWTYEHPVEFDLSTIPNRMGPLTQSEIPRDLKSFSAAPKNASRRAGDCILVGECNDLETMQRTLELAGMGPCLYTTIHTGSVPGIPSRIITSFPPEQQYLIAAAFVETARLLVYQELVDGANGGRVALREYLVINAQHRKQLKRTDPSQFSQLLEEFVEQDGQPLLIDARRKFEAGLITEETYEYVRFSAGEGV